MLISWSGGGGGGGGGGGNWRTQRKIPGTGRELNKLNPHEMLSMGSNVGCRDVSWGPSNIVIPTTILLKLSDVILTS